MDDKFEILSGRETPISLIDEKQMAGLAEQLADFIKSGDPRARRLREFIEAGYSPEEIAHKINKLLIKMFVIFYFTNNFLIKLYLGQINEVNDIDQNSCILIYIR